MIKEAVELKRRVDAFVTRICDECGKEEPTRMLTVILGREVRKADIDLCRSCSTLSKYRHNRFSDKMENAVNWKGGRSKDRKNGYYRIYTGDGKRLFEHILLYEQYYKTKLLPGQKIHHIDMNKTNNKVQNLHLCNDRAEHMSCHFSAERCGFNKFGKHIWFDWVRKEYSLKRRKRPKAVQIDLAKITTGHSVAVKTHSRDHGVAWKAEYFCYEQDGRFYNKYLHVAIAEYMLGRRLCHNECVHHVDGNSLNNSVDNLCVLTKSEHALAHKSIQQCVAALYNKGLVRFENGFYY